jgi:uncharacterized protein DUF87
VSSKLHIAEGLSLPAECVTEKLAFLGRTGSGKSYAAMKLAEEFARIGAQFVVIDPVGMWWGLRLHADGITPGIDIPVLGGLHGDIPLESSAGALVADLIVDRGTSCILDVSQFESDADRSRFAEAWASRFFYRKKSASSAVHVFVEEAQEFVPQNTQRGEERMLHAFQRLEKLGRNFGIGVSLISQRPQEVNKKALNQTELLFAFQMTGPQERKAVEGWIADKGVDEDISGELPKLSRGEPHVWSPAWLKVSKTVHVGERWTFDASSTPKVGKTAAARELAPIDLDALRKQMAATIERAKADDPKLLRAEIAKLKSSLTKANKADAQTVDRPSIQAAVEQAVARSRATWDRDVATQRNDIMRAARRISGTVQKMVALAADEIAIPLGAILKSLEEPSVVSSSGSGNGNSAVPHRAAAAPHPRAPRPVSGAPPDGQLGKGERACLSVIVHYPDGVTSKQLTVTTGYKRSTRNTYLQRLRAAGYVEARGDAFIATDAGIAALGSNYEPLPSGQELLDHYLATLPEGERAILQIIATDHPSPVDRERLSDDTGYQRSTRNTYLQRLVARQLVTSARGGSVMLSPSLAREVEA